MKTGTIIILNGTSSSGKSSIVKELQGLFKEPFLDAGLDRFLWMLPGRYLSQPLWDDVLGLATTAGPTGHRLVRGMHLAIAAMASAGNNVVADHVLIDPVWVDHCAEVLGNLPAWLIGVYCPLEILEQRERERQDRTLGQARAQFDLVHHYCHHYDLVVDTSILTPLECALEIRQAVLTGSPTALMKRRQTPVS